MPCIAKGCKACFYAPERAQKIKKDYRLRGAGRAFTLLRASEVLTRCYFQEYIFRLLYLDFSTLSVPGRELS